MGTDPNDAAVRLVAEGIWPLADLSPTGREELLRDVANGVARIFDPANFDDPLDVSVCLRDVVKALGELRLVEEMTGESRTLKDVADYLKRKFGGGRP